MAHSREGVGVADATKCGRVGRACPARVQLDMTCAGNRAFSSAPRIRPQWHIWEIAFRQSSG